MCKKTKHSDPWWSSWEVQECIHALEVIHQTEPLHTANVFRIMGIMGIYSPQSLTLNPLQIHRPRHMEDMGHSSHEPCSSCI